MVSFPGQPGLARQNQSGFKWGKRWWGYGMQWHQLDHMQAICISLQADNHINTSSVKFLQAGCSSLCPTDSVKALKAKIQQYTNCNYQMKRWKVYHVTYKMSTAIKCCHYKPFPMKVAKTLLCPFSSSIYQYQPAVFQPGLPEIFNY